MLDFSQKNPIFKEREYEIFNFRRKAVYEKDAICSDIRYPVIRTSDLHDLSHNVDTDMYWLVHNDVEDFNDEFVPFSYDREYIHNFNVKLASGKVIRNGVRLVPHNVDVEKQKDVDTVVGSLRSPERVEARTVEEALSLATQDTFWMVNPDLQLTDTTIDDFYPDLYDGSYTYLEVLFT